MTTEVPAAQADALDEDRLPWLEAVEEDERGPSPAKLIAAVLIGLVAIGIIVGGLFWLGNRAAGGGGEELIASPGDYKMPAPEPGGMKVDNGSATQVATSEGTEQNAVINPNARPEAPVTQPQQPAAAQPPVQATQQQPAQAQPKAAPAPQQPQQQAQAQPRPQPALSGPTIQVGAYPSEAAATQQWQRINQRFPFTRGLQHQVIVYQAGGRTYYRLRAAGGQAREACRRMQGAGQPCFNVQ
jgi:hypothetical protein